MLYETIIQLLITMLAILLCYTLHSLNYNFSKKKYFVSCVYTRNEKTVYTNDVLVVEKPFYSIRDFDDMEKILQYKYKVEKVIILSVTELK